MPEIVQKGFSSNKESLKRILQLQSTIITIKYSEGYALNLMNCLKEISGQMCALPENSFQISTNNTLRYFVLFFSASVSEHQMVLLVRNVKS